MLTDGDYVIDMKIGMDAGATNGFDRLIDVLAAPAPPLDDVFDGFIQGDDNLWWDIRNNASDTASFVVELIPRTDNGPVTVSWDPTGLAALGSFWIEERSPLQGNFYLDMTTSSQFVTTGPPDLSYGFMIKVDLGGGSPITIPAIEDAFVRGGNAYKDLNYGTSDTLHVQDGGSNPTRREAYLKFDLSSITDSVTVATLKLYPFEVAGSGPIEHAIWYMNRDTTWSESTITWLNKPAPTSLIGTWSPVQGSVVSIDVTSFVEDVRTTADDSLLSFQVVSNTVSSSDWALYSSREHPNGFHPILEITTTGGGSTNQSPTVSITQPTNGATFTEGDSILLEATASDSDGTVTKVEYFAGSTLLGEGTGANYSFTWNGAGVGSHALTAVATDNDGATTTSSVVNITVNASGGGPITVTAIEDAFVRGGNAYKDLNYGTSDTLHVQDGGSNPTRREAYLKFDLSSITDSVTVATLKLYPFEVAGSGPIEHAIWYMNRDTTWSESTITWLNKPAPTSLIGTWSPVQGSVVSIDVTSFVEDVRTTADDSLLSFQVVSNTVSSSDWALYSSREHPNGFHPILEITTTGGGSKGIQGTAIDDADEPPERFTLHGNYPNPFNPSTTISFDLPEESVVHVEIYDLMGRQVMTTPEQRMSSGSDARISIEASSLASGVYIYRVIAVMARRSAIETGRMTLVK